MSEECMGEPDPTWIEKRRAEQPSMVAPKTSRKPGEYDTRNLLADVAFNRHSMNDGHHVSPSDNGMLQIGTDGIEVVLAQGIDEEAFKRTTSAATRATIGLDLSQPLPGDWEPCDSLRAAINEDLGAEGDFSDWSGPKEHEVPPMCGHHAHRVAGDRRVFTAEGKVPYQDWEEMLKGGLQTALETQTIVFAVSGVSRTCTHQLVRSRRAAFHQQSQRAGYMGDMPECRMPESVWRNENARNAFLRAVIASWRAYRIACDEDISYQDARFILPEGTTNFILLEYPVREFLNVYAYRGCSMFQWEIVQVMRQCRDVLVAAHPWMEPYVKVSCEKTGPVMLNIDERSPGGNTASGQVRIADHHCTFQGWEDVEGQCDFPWAKEEARTFKPTYHRISRRTGKDA